MADEGNKRYIDIDDDTRVGYSYIKSKFYVTNKGYTTYRTTIPQIQAVLHSLNVASIPDEDLEKLKSEIETLHTIYYTWHDTGSYIKTLQFNDFEEYPLTIDCDKKKIYIMNSNIVYDLDINESIKNVRVPYLCTYYKTKLGLEISQKDMLYFYNLLYGFYKPTVYNQIALPDELEKDPTNLSYTNMFFLSNYDNSSRATYYGVYNALNKTIPTDTGLYIDKINANTQCIETVVEADSIGTGDTIILDNTEEPNSQYSANGTYTVSAIEENKIYVEETIPTSYIFPHRTCSLISTEVQIQSISRASQTITLTSPVPSTILVGDTIHITGTTQNVEYETITCDGSYIVASIGEYEITVEEEIPTDFISTEEQKGYVYKEVFLSNVKREEGNTIYLLKNITLTILPNAKVNVYDPVDYSTNTYTMASYTTNSITVSEDLPTYIPDYPTIKKEEPSTETLVDVTNSDLEHFPEGEFLLDNFDQASAYIQTASNGVKYPKQIIGYNLYGKVAKVYPIEETDTGITSMQLQGLFSKIYKDETK